MSARPADMVPEDPRGWRLGGGVTYGALTTRGSGCGRRRSSASTRGRRRRRSSTCSARRGSTCFVPLDEGPIFHNLETPRAVCRRASRPACRSRCRPPASWLAASGLVVGAGRRRAARRLGRLVPPEAHVAVGVAGLPARPEAGSGSATAAPALADPAPGRSGRGQPHDVGRRPCPGFVLMRPGADLLITQGDDGGLLIRVGPDGPVEIAALPADGDRRRARSDRRGRHVPCRAPRVVLRPAVVLGPARLRLDLRFAAAAGSLVVEGVGL